MQQIITAAAEQGVIACAAGQTVVAGSTQQVAALHGRRHAFGHRIAVQVVIVTDGEHRDLLLQEIIARPLRAIAELHQQVLVAGVVGEVPQLDLILTVAEYQIQVVCIGVAGQGQVAG